MKLFALLRALVVAPLFILIWLRWLPLWLVGPNAFADPRPLGWIVVAVGAVVGVPCIWQFAWRGFGTPAPWDPPRKLVISGPYRYVRNPMYVGMGIAIAGFAVVFPHARQLLRRRARRRLRARLRLHRSLRRADAARPVRRRLRRLLPPRPPLDSAALPVVRSRAPGLIWR